MSCYSVFVPLSAVVHPSTAERTNSHYRKRLGNRATLGQGRKCKGMSARGKIVEVFRGSDDPDKRYRACLGRIKHVKIQRIGSRPYIPRTLHVKLDRQRTDRTITNKDPPHCALDPSVLCPLLMVSTKYSYNKMLICRCRIILMRWYCCNSICKDSYSDVFY